MRMHRFVFTLCHGHRCRQIACSQHMSTHPFWSVVVDEVRTGLTADRDDLGTKLIDPYPSLLDALDAGVRHAATELLA